MVISRENIEYLKKFAEEEMETYDFSGVISVIKNDAVIYETCRGYASLEFGIPNTIDTKFSIASVSKQFTAFAVMLLYDRKLLSIDASAADYLPDGLDLPKDISIHHLLSHTSGLYNIYNFEDDFYIGENRLPYDKKAFFDKWVMKKPRKEAGKEFEYNNTNYHLLAWIIEHVSGQSFGEFLRSNIFIPLGMVNTGFDDGMAVIPGKAQNYMRDFGKQVRVPYENLMFHMGAGGMYSSCRDLQIWYKALRDRKLLSQQTYDRYFTQNEAHYCYGLEHFTGDGMDFFVHGGDANGVSTLLIHNFKEDQCIIILSNTESLSQYRLSKDITDILSGKRPEHPKKPEEVRVDEKFLQRFSGTYLPGKISMEIKNGKLYLVRENQNIHIELYYTGNNTFIRRFEEQNSPYVLLEEGKTRPSIWGCELKTELNG